MFWLEQDPVCIIGDKRDKENKDPKEERKGHSHHYIGKKPAAVLCMTASMSKPKMFESDCQVEIIFLMHILEVFPVDPPSF